MKQAYIKKHLILVGGGHANIQVVREFAMRPDPSLLITMVSSEEHAAYSGMLPGYLAGWYKFEEVHFDLRLISEKAGIRFIHDRVVKIDSNTKQVFFASRPQMTYDICSVNVGIQPKISGELSESDRVLAVKPVGNFVKKWNTLLGKKGLQKVAIVGAGAAGFEIANILRNRAPETEIEIFEKSSQLLPGHSKASAHLAKKVLESNKIKLYLGKTFQGQDLAKFDKVILATQASPPKWFQHCSFEKDESGYAAVAATLQSRSSPSLFFSGDCAQIEGTHLPRAGVFAVRQGKILKKNIRRSLQKRKLLYFKPQRTFLSLITTGEKNVILSKGILGWKGKLLWNLKDWIDRKFMRKFSSLPSMNEDYDQDEVGMLCGGCGAKVGSSSLRGAFEQMLSINQEFEDAAETSLTGGVKVFQSIDHLENFINDPYLLGQIATQHALSDLFAMGAIPVSALTLAQVPRGRPNRVQEDLTLLLQGATQVLKEAGARLVGGHSIQSTTLGFGVSVLGEMRPKASLMKKSALMDGDFLILTKPLGVGVTMAAYKGGTAPGRVVGEVIQGMLQSNRVASEILLKHGVQCCTDVTGFGLGGHLSEMLGVKFSVYLDLDSLPLYSGVLDFFEEGVKSSIAGENEFSFLEFFQPEPEHLRSIEKHKKYPFLFDPQTSGGLLAAVAPSTADAVLKELHENGYQFATVIGEVTNKKTDSKLKITQSGIYRKFKKTFWPTREILTSFEGSSRSISGKNNPTL